MEPTTILQHWIFARFLFPLVLVFFLVFAILEKTKIFGDDKKQINAGISLVIALIFVGFAFPKEVVENMILFLTIGLVVMFVGLMFWGFAIGDTPKFTGKYLPWTAGIGIFIAVTLALIWSTGYWSNFSKIIEAFFTQSWSELFWTNVIFILVLAAAVALVLKSGGKEK